jgi:hypothetical protein
MIFGALAMLTGAARLIDTKTRNIMHTLRRQLCNVFLPSILGGVSVIRNYVRQYSCLKCHLFLAMFTIFLFGSAYES